MRLVVQYHSSEYSVDILNVIPVEYESKEKFIEDHKNLCDTFMKEYLSVGHGTNTWLAGHNWSILDFYDPYNYIEPIVLTVDEWYE